MRNAREISVKAAPAVPLFSFSLAYFRVLRSLSVSALRLLISRHSSGGDAFATLSRA